MGIDTAIADFMCQAYPKRGSRKMDKGIDEWLYAETAAYVQFAKDFKRRHGSDSIVMGQLDYKYISTPKNPAVQFIIDAMQVYFRNWWSRNNPNRVGGFRKPDGLGISPNGDVIEIIEVKPYYNYPDGVAQLNEMIDKIKTGLDDYYQEQSLKTMTSVGPDPSNFVTVKGAKWRPSGDGLEIPLIDPSSQEIAWICFRPTLRPFNGTLPIDGVTLYEIHTLEKSKYPQRIPDNVARRLRDAFDRQKQAANWNPLAQQYVRTNPADAELIRNLAITVGIVAAVAIIALAVVAAAPIVAGAGAAAIEGAAVMDTTMLIGGSYRIAPILVRVAMDEGEIVEFVEEVATTAKTMVMR